MENKSDYSEDLKIIKKIMEESSRFLSLSGLSGLFAGLLAVVGGCIAHFGILKSKTLVTGESLSMLSVKEISSIKIQLFSCRSSGVVFCIGRSILFFFQESASQRPEDLDSGFQKDALEPLHPTRCRCLFYSDPLFCRTMAAYCPCNAYFLRSRPYQRR